MLHVLYNAKMLYPEITTLCERMEAVCTRIKADEFPADLDLLHMTPRFIDEIAAGRHATKGLLELFSCGDKNLPAIDYADGLEPLTEVEEGALFGRALGEAGDVMRSLMPSQEAWLDWRDQGGGAEAAAQDGGDHGEASGEEQIEIENEDWDVVENTGGEEGGDTEMAE